MNVLTVEEEKEFKDIIYSSRQKSEYFISYIMRQIEEDELFTKFKLFKSMELLTKLQAQNRGVKKEIERYKY